MICIVVRQSNGLSVGTSSSPGYSGGVVKIRADIPGGAAVKGDTITISGIGCSGDGYTREI